MDATFNVTRFKAVKLITILSQDAQRQIVLGCVGILLGAEFSGNITALSVLSSVMWPNSLFTHFLD